MKKEIEIKLAFETAPLEMRRRLESLGSVVQSERVFEDNVLYDDASFSLVRAGRLLRLRRTSPAPLAGAYEMPREPSSGTPEGGSEVRGLPSASAAVSAVQGHSEFTAGRTAEPPIASAQVAPEAHGPGESPAGSSAESPLACAQVAPRAHGHGESPAGRTAEPPIASAQVAPGAHGHGESPAERATAPPLTCAQEEALLTYKEPAGDLTGPYKVRGEIELTIGSPDMLDTILGRLGFRPVYRYQKYRTVLRLGAAGIFIDETPIGNFLELEAEGEEIDALASRLGYGPGDYITATYRELHERSVAHSGKEPGDMVFLRE